MRRLWLPFGRRVMVLIALLAVLVALFPLRIALDLFALDGAGVSARRVSGSIWSGRIVDLNVANVPLGTIQASLSPLDLLIGRARLRIARPADGNADPLTGAVLVSRHSLGVTELTATLPLAGALAPLPIGNLAASGLDARFDDGVCVRAGGRLRATLAGDFAGVSLAQGLSGNAACDGRYIRLPLASQSGQERLDLRIALDGSYVADLVAIEPAADRVAALAALGFTAVPGGYRLRVTGRFG